MKISGIYKITNKTNDHSYIGKGTSIKARWKHHISKLNKNIHHSKYFQHAWNKYGKDCFTFGILEEVEDLDLLHEKEVYWYNYYSPEYCIMHPDSSSGVMTHSEGSI